jgi:beta-xylosidase
MIKKLFFDDDGKVYFSAVNMITEPRVKKHGLGLATFTAEIDLATGRCLGPAKWNRLSDFGLGIAEGPHIFKKDGFYYLSTAEGGTDEGHQQWIFRSTAGPFGPWEEGPKGAVNPVIFNDNDPSIRSTGHLDFIETANGDWFAVFLGVRPQGEKSELLSQLGRETFMSHVEWIDGWPIVNGRKPISLQMQARGMELLSQPQVWRDEFQDSTLQLGWYHLRTPLKKDYSLSERPGSLSLYGNAYRIDDFECPSMLLRKQTGFSGDWRVKFIFAPKEAGHEAGTAIWWSQFAYASIGLRKPFDESKSGLEIVSRCYNEVEDQFKVCSSDSEL